MDSHGFAWIRMRCMRCSRGARGQERPGAPGPGLPAPRGGADEPRRGRALRERRLRPELRRPGARRVGVWVRFNGVGWGKLREAARLMGVPWEGKKRGAGAFGTFGPKEGEGGLDVCADLVLEW